MLGSAHLNLALLGSTTLLEYCCRQLLGCCCRKVALGDILRLVPYKNMYISSMLRPIIVALSFAAFIVPATLANAQGEGDDAAPCRGYIGPGGACYIGPGGGLYVGPGGGLYHGPGGGLYTGPGGGLYAGPGGGMYAGPGGGLYRGPGGGLYSGPGGGVYIGPPTKDGYTGPWGPCITGALGKRWMQNYCPA